MTYSVQDTSMFMYLILRTVAWGSTIIVPISGMRRLHHQHSERLVLLLSWWIAQPGLLMHFNPGICVLSFSAPWFTWGRECSAQFFHDASILGSGQGPGLAFTLSITAKGTRAIVFVQIYRFPWVICTNCYIWQKWAEKPTHVLEISNILEGKECN